MCFFLIGGIPFSPGWWHHPVLELIQRLIQRLRSARKKHTPDPTAHKRREISARVHLHLLHCFLSLAQVYLHLFHGEAREDLHEGVVGAFRAAGGKREQAAKTVRDVRMRAGAVGKRGMRTGETAGYAYRPLGKARVDGRRPRRRGCGGDRLHVM